MNIDKKKLFFNEKYYTNNLFFIYFTFSNLQYEYCTTIFLLFKFFKQNIVKQYRRPTVCYLLLSLVLQDMFLFHW